MANEPADKYQILLKGGVYRDSNNSLENWLNFLTDPDNLQPGLPDLTIDCLYRNYSSSYSFKAHVSFDKTKASLKSLVIKLQCPFQYGILVFQETDTKIIEAKPTYSFYMTSNPHHLREWIFNMFMNTELEHVDVGFLNEELPDLFDHLPRLKTVDLRNSNLNRLPPSFFRQSELESLDLTGCSIAEVPPDLGQVQSLQRLTFSQPCSPSVLGRLRGLISLTCSCTAFDIPEDITQLNHLKYLNLHDVGSIPDNFLNFQKLEFLYFHATKNLVAINFGEVHVPALKELNTNCPAVFATSIARFQNLEQIIAGGMPLTKPELDSLTNSIRQLSKLTHASLHGVGITTVEFCLSLPQLKWLDLSSNAIVDVPAGLGMLRDLRFLDLSRNSIAHVPADLNDLYKAGLLFLEDNPILSYPDLNIRNDAKQKIIREGGMYKLASEKDETLVEWLTFLTNPQYLQPGLPDLTIHCQGYGAIKVSFDKRKASLRSLHLELSEYISKNTNLFEYTDLQSQNTPSADRESNLHHLREWVYNLFLHSELEELKAPFRNTELPDQFNTLTNLKTVDFSRSKLTKLPQSFYHLRSLETLLLNDAPISEIPDHINQLANLTSLNLCRTALTRLPENLFQLRSLEHLYLERTSIAELPNHFDTLPKLKTLSLNTSNLIQLPSSFFQLHALENLLLEGISFIELPDRFDTLNKLKNVSINISGLRQLPSSLFQGSIENLNLEKCSITELPDRFDTLTKLKNFTLSNAALTQLPTSFFQLPALENLYLDGTSITELPDHFDTLNNLKKISLSNTKISCLPPSFFLMPALEWLDLKDSSLPEIPSDLGKLRTLGYLSLSQPVAPATWTGLTELIELQCYCPDFQVPKEFTNLINLKTLNLSSVSLATYESMNLPRLEKLRFKRSQRYSPFPLEGNLPNLNELTTDYIEAFYPSLREGVLSRRKVSIIT